MKKQAIAVLLLVILMLFVLSACVKTPTEELDETPVEKPAEIPDREPAKGPAEKPDDEEKIGGDRVNAYFDFDSYDEYVSFYSQFITCNSQRYFAPKAETGDFFDTVEYAFSAGGVPMEIARNKIYASEFPRHEITFSFSKVDRETVFVHKVAAIWGTLHDVSGQDVSGAVRFEAVDEKGNYKVYIGDALVCSFRISTSSHFDANEYLNLMKGAFA